MVENEHVRSDFRRILEEQPNISDSKIISTWFFQATNVSTPNQQRG